MPRIDEITLFHPPGRFPRRKNPFGKDIANAGLFGALVRHGAYRRVNVLNQPGIPADQIAADLFPDQEVPLTLESGSLLSTTLPARSGVVLRGQPYLSELAWLRRAHGLDGDYSLVGLIHTIAPPAIREMIGAAALAPVHDWDALVCTSPAVQEAITAMFEAWTGHLHDRFGGLRSPRPRLPLIPLGVDVETIADQASAPAARSELRSRCGLDDDAVLVLWVGRLSFFEKAFPQAMFQAVQEAAVKTGRRLDFALVGWYPNGDDDRRRYHEAAAALAPDVQIHDLDGNDPAVVAQAWAAADIFLSLVDNVQETFGLAPVEAMAAGLPVVVSDWDGYRYTVRHESEGFLIPTLGMTGSGPGELLAHLHSFSQETYQTYVGAVAQHTAVHVGEAAAALTRLIDSPELRRSMGAAGQKRAREMFSWPVVVSQYNDLFADLADRRHQAPPLPLPHPHRLHPLRGDPFADFAGFASQVLEPTRRLRFRQGMGAHSLNRIRGVELDRFFPGLRASPRETQQMLELLARAEPTIGLDAATIEAAFAPNRRPFVRASLVWLAKLGILDWLPVQADAEAGSPAPEHPGRVPKAR